MTEQYALFEYLPEPQPVERPKESLKEKVYRFFLGDDIFKQIALAYEDGFIRIWNVNSTALADSKILYDAGALHPSMGRIDALAFDPQGQSLAAVIHGENIKIWGIIGGREVANFKHSGIMQVSFSPDVSYLVSASFLDKTARVRSGEYEQAGVSVNYCHQCQTPRVSHCVASDGKPTLEKYDISIIHHLLPFVTLSLCDKKHFPCF